MRQTSERSKIPLSLINTVLLKSKLTLETRTSSLDARNVRGSSLEYRVSRIESRGSRNKAFSNMQKLERVSRKRFISRTKNNTAHTLSHENIRPYDSGLNVIFFPRHLVFKTKCRPGADDGNLPVNADNPLRSEPFAKFLK